MPPGISLSDFYYILPEIVLTVAALVRARGGRAAAEGQPGAGLGDAGGSRRDAAVAAAVRRHPGRGLERAHRGRLVRALLQDHLPHRGGDDRADVGPLSRGRRRQPGRVLLPDSVRDARHDDHGRRHRSHHELHRARDDGGVVLHPGRLHQAEPAVERSRGEVLPARRLLAGDSALRHVAAVRPVGHHQSAGDGHDLRRAAAQSAADSGRDSGRGRHGLQDRGGAVPHVGARRVRRRADADHRVPVGRFEGRLVRDAAADSSRGRARR